MAVTNLITIAEADTFNALSASWLMLTANTKTIHIFNASVYMQANWNCTDVDWADTTTLDSDMKRACAYYAEADRVGVLNTAVAAVDPHGKVTEETRKLGSMQKTTKWDEAGANVAGDPLESINAIMSLYCTTKSRFLTRV